MAMLRKFESYEQIERMLLEYETGSTESELAAKYGVTQATVSRKVVRYAGLSARWIKFVINSKHQLYWLGKRINKTEKLLRASAGVIKKLQRSPKQRSNMSVAIRAEYGLNRAESQKVLAISPRSRGPKATKDDDAILIGMMKDYFLENPGQGFGMAFKALLKNQPCTHKHAFSVYTQCVQRLKDRPKGKSPVPGRVSQPMKVQGLPNLVWSMDFVVDVLPCGTRYFVLNVVDDFNREAVVIRVVLRNTAKSVIEALEEARQFGRNPKCIRTDNGSEFRSSTYRTWAKRNGISCIYSQPGRPNENSYVERFNGTLRREVLSRYEFKSIHEVQRMADDWRIRYNLSRPNRSLGGLSPVQYAHAAKIGSLEGAPQTI